MVTEAGGQLNVRFPEGSKRVTETSHYSQLHSSTLSTMATQFTLPGEYFPEKCVFSMTVHCMELQWAVEMAKLWCNMCWKLICTITEELRGTTVWGEAQRIPCTQLFPFQEPSAHQKPFWSARGAWGHKDRWEPELRISEDGTLSLLGLSQGCPSGVSALVARRETRPDE